MADSFRTSWLSGTTIRPFRLVALLALLFAGGCGGQLSDSFARSVYVEINSGGVLSPSSIPAPNGYRIVFLNNDSVVHIINWNSPLNLAAAANPGDRAWFELPNLLPGTVMSYHLDAAGAAGSVTIVAGQTP